MNGVRIAIVALVVLCVWVAWPKGDASAPPRPLLIRAALRQVDDPIVILGDRIVERASLPRIVCGRAMVNAGIADSTTSSNLPAMLNKSLAGKKAAMIVVSLGANDAAGSLSAENYRASYQAMIAELVPLADRISLMAVSPLEAPLQTNWTTVDGYNAVLSDLAKAMHVRFIPLPAMPMPHTSDGIHLNAAGYRVWTAAVLGGIEAALCNRG